MQEKRKLKRYFIGSLFFVLLGVSITPIPTPNKDFYIQWSVHFDAYYSLGVPRPEENYTKELWFNENKLALVTDKYKLIVDLEQNALFIIDLGKKEYIETSLPLDWARIIPVDLSGWLKGQEQQGTILETKQTQKIKKWMCNEYTIHSLAGNLHSPAYEFTTKGWYTKDIPFDLKDYYKMYTTILKCKNYSDSFIAGLTKINGFLIASETIKYTKLSDVKSTLDAQEISTKTPPQEIYSVPNGCTKKGELTATQIRNLMRD